MTQKKILYTDGHEVTVTDSFFQVKKTLYLLGGITNHGFLVIHPDRLPAFLMLIVGAMMITVGGLHMIPRSSIPDVEFYTIELSANTLFMGIGLGFLVIASLLMGLMRNRYAVRIATAEGEKNVLVSRRKEYIEQIVEALNRAFFHFVPRGKKTSRAT
jgi:hypothetical protein